MHLFLNTLFAKCHLALDSGRFCLLGYWSCSFLLRRLTWLGFPFAQEPAICIANFVNKFWLRMPKQAAATRTS